MPGLIRLLTGNKSMKILQLGKFYPVRGGVEKVMYDLTAGLSARGIACDMMCVGSEGGTSEVRLNDCASLICCHNLVKIAATMISPALVNEFRLRCGSYDIVHIHHPDPMACAALYYSGYKGRVVLHWHSDILKQKFLLKLYRPFQDWLVRRADVIVGTSPVYLENSPWLADVGHKTVCIPIGIRPVPRDEEAVLKIRSRYAGKKIIFSLGRLIEYKGYDNLINAETYLDDDFVVLIGGVGPLRNSLEKLIRKAGLEHRVTLLGFVEDKALSDLYHACDVFCLSSIQKTEAFGIVQVEAMSCGKPVVSTKIPGSGVSWVNRDGFSGINVAPEDPRALAEAIRMLVSDTDVYDRFSQNARSRFEEMFTEEKMIDECVGLYEKLLYDKD